MNFHQQDHWWEQHEALHAVDGVSFTLKEGKTLALVGESGSGKTTLAKALLQLVPLNSGEIKINDEVILKTIIDARAITLATNCLARSYSSLNPRLSVRDILAEGLAVQGKSAITEKAITDLLQRVGLPATSADRYPHQFSGGQRQRIAIARALAARPKIVICD